MIWGNGRDGRDFLKALSYEARTKLKGFGDIDPKKIARGYQYERGGTMYPVVYFDQLVPPVVICVAMDRGGQLEKKRGINEVERGRGLLSFLLNFLSSYEFIFSRCGRLYFRTKVRFCATAINFLNAWNNAAIIILSKWIVSF